MNRTNYSQFRMKRESCIANPGLPERLSPKKYPQTSKATKDSVLRIAYSGQLNRPTKADKQPGLCEKHFKDICIWCNLDFDFHTRIRFFS
jgi:hypothetical protein